MKQEPFLPLIETIVNIPLSQRMMVSSAVKKSGYIMGGCFIVIAIYLFCSLMAFWFMKVPKHEELLHSTIEVTFELPEPLSLPEVTPVLPEDIQSKALIPTVEPNTTSELLPAHEDIASIPTVMKPQQHFIQKKRDVFHSQPSEQMIPINSALHAAKDNEPKEGKQSSISAPLVKPATKSMSMAQRCNALLKDYPMAARRRHEQGTVQVKYQLLPNGQVNQVEIMETSGFSDLDRAALHAVQVMKCQAALEQPIIKATIPVHFSLNNRN